MLDFVPPQLLFVLALISGLILIVKAWRKHNWAIFSASLPRLYLAGVYFWISYFDAPIYERQVMGRLAIIFLLGIEIVNQLTNRRGVTTHDRR